MDKKKPNSPVYLILGATTPLAQSLAHQLKPHSHIILVDKDGPALKNISCKLNTMSITSPLLHWKEVLQLVLKSKKSYGRIDGIVLVPNIKETERWGDIETKQFLNQAFFVVKAATRAMIEPSPSILLVSPAIKQNPTSSLLPAREIEEGLITLTQIAHDSYGMDKLRINCVTQKNNAKITNPPPPSSPNLPLVSHPWGRLQTTVEITQAMAWMISPLQKNIAGQNLVVDNCQTSIRKKLSPVKN